MTRPIEPLHPSHPAHVIHHSRCNHILRRVLIPDPQDPENLGCICDMPPEAIWHTRRFERNGVHCELDELAMEARTVDLECSWCVGEEARASQVANKFEMDLSSQEDNEIGAPIQRSRTRSRPKRILTGKGKSVHRRKPKAKAKGKGKGKNKGKAVPATPTTKLANGFNAMALDEPPTYSGLKDGGDSDEGLTVEEKIWKHLRGRSVWSRSD